MSDYRFELMDPTSSVQLEEMSALLRLVFPNANHLTPRYLAWQYAANPDGDAIGCNAYLDGALVGHMAATPMVARVEEEFQRGLFMLNGAVHRDHRRRRLQSNISAVIFDEMVRQGYRFCFGTGNRYSTKPLLTRFKMMLPLEARIGIGPLRRRKSAPTPSFARVWSDAAIHWRLANPERDYTRTARGRELAILAPAGTIGLSTMLYAGANPWDLPPAGRPGPLRLWLGLDPAIDWKRSAYLPIPARLRPSPLNLVFKDLSGGDFLPDPARVLFRGLDFDPY